LILFKIIIFSFYENLIEPFNRGPNST